MKRKEKLVVHGNEFYVIDLDCLERKGKNRMENTEKEDIGRNLMKRKKENLSE